MLLLEVLLLLEVGRHAGHELIVGQRHRRRFSSRTGRRRCRCSGATPHCAAER
jgi:hypothetical protein